MEFSLSDEQQMLRDGADRYLAQHYAFDQRRAVLESPSRVSAAHWSQFAELGWLALSLPEDVGGLGLSFTETTLVLEAMGRRLVLEPYSTTAVLCARVLDRADNAEARAEALPQIASGALRVALAHEEPEGRRTTVRRDGSSFILDGVKLLSYDAPSAGKLIVTAREGSDAAHSIWFVDASAPGLRLDAYPLIDGTLAADVSFSRVQLGAAQRLAGPDTADGVLAEALDRMVLGRVAEALGAMDVIMQITAEQIRNRSQFGQPLARFQALQHRMAEMFVEVQETRSILYRGLAYLDASPAERGAAVSAAKVVASAAGRIVGGQGIQLHGAVGMTEEYAVGHYFRRLIVLEKAFGDTDHHLARLAGTYR